MGEKEKSFSVSELQTFLQGEWSLERRVFDRRAGQEGHLTGGARFVPEGEGLLYREAGHLAIGDYEGPALQSYRYAFPTPERAAISFGDGRFFHDLDLTTGAWHCIHLCAPDRYHGDFTALGPDAWRVVWTVAGPRKDLILDSSYRRGL